VPTNMSSQQKPSVAKEDLVSVIIPARNEQTILPRCLAALHEQQSAREFELIVVDSASTDRTQQVARSFGARVIRLEEPGLGRARQAGFEAARGEIILSTDADAVPSEDWIERLVAPFHDFRGDRSIWDDSLHPWRSQGKDQPCSLLRVPRDQSPFGVAPVLWPKLRCQKGCVPCGGRILHIRRLPERGRGYSLRSETEQDREDRVLTRCFNGCFPTQS